MIVIASGSKGNAVLHHNSILVDCGVAFAMLKPYLKDIQIVLLTHEHGDHLVLSTLQRLVFERPTLRIGCCEWMLPHLEGIKNVDVYELGKLYDYGQFKLSPIKLYHDVPNCGYRVFKDNHKTIHATDTYTLECITAKGYDLFAIESNYNEDTVWETIERIEAAGGFSHQRGSINTHLSEQSCNEFYYSNRAAHSKLVRLHQTSTI